MPHEQPWLDNETRIINVTPMEMYKILFKEYMYVNSLTSKDISLDTLTRRANIYAVKHTWRRYNLHYGRIV